MQIELVSSLCKHQRVDVDRGSLSTLRALALRAVVDGATSFRILAL